MDVLRERTGHVHKNTIAFGHIATSAETFKYNHWENDRGGKFIPV